MKRLLFLSTLAAVMTACTPTTSATQSGKLPVVATMSIIGDVVSQIGGEHIDLTVLMEAGQDPHSFEASPADAARIEKAVLVFSNGLGLEESLLPLIEAAPPTAKVVRLSEGLDGIIEPTPGSPDPHTWQDPTNVMAWVEKIAAALSEADPEHAEDYRTNADRYLAKLEQLDGTIKSQVERIPKDQRKLITNHDSLGYFARRYGFTIVGIVYENVGAEPSAGEISDLVDAIMVPGVKAVFVENTASDQFARIIVDEMENPVSVLSLYTDALDVPGTPGDTYIGMMTTNIDTIVSGLLGE